MFDPIKEDIVCVSHLPLSLEASSPWISDSGRALLNKGAMGLQQVVLEHSASAKVMGKSCLSVPF